MHEKSTLCGNYDCPNGYFCAKLMDNPDWGVTNFDNILSSFLMIFQTVTLEGWSKIMENVRVTFNDLAIFYFIFLVFVGSFFLLNITLAVIKAKFTESQGEGKPKLKKISEEKNRIPKKQYLLYMNEWSDLQFRKNMFFLGSSSRTIVEGMTRMEKIKYFLTNCFSKKKDTLKKKPMDKSHPLKKEISIDEHLALKQDSNVVVLENLHQRKIKPSGLMK